jgi:hypothetical protein
MSHLEAVEIVRRLNRELFEAHDKAVLNATENERKLYIDNLKSLLVQAQSILAPTSRDTSSS